MTGSYTDASTDAYGLDALLLSLLRVLQQMLLKAMNLDLEPYILVGSW